MAKFKKAPSKLAETRAKINVTKRRLEEMKEYKILMRLDGMMADIVDKERESKMIVNLIRLERKLADMEGRPYKATKPGDSEASTKRTRSPNDSRPISHTRPAGDPRADKEEYNSRPRRSDSRGSRDSESGEIKIPKDRFKLERRKSGRDERPSDIPRNTITRYADSNSRKPGRHNDSNRSRAPREDDRRTTAASERSPRADDSRNLDSRSRYSKTDSEGRGSSRSDFDSRYNSRSSGERDRNSR